MKYRLLHPAESKGNVPWNRQRKKNCILSHSAFICRVYPGSLRASQTVTENLVHNDLLFPVNQQAYCIDIYVFRSLYIPGAGMKLPDQLLLVRRHRCIIRDILVYLLWCFSDTSWSLRSGLSGGKKTLLARMLCSLCLRSFMREFGCLMFSNSKRKIKVLCTTSFCQVLRWGLGECVTNSDIWKSHFQLHLIWL